MAASMSIVLGVDCLVPTLLLRGLVFIPIGVPLSKLN
uniref:Uncharacterized protein n=1 Tax=Oryza sativa subsp. japonica TaxID=39947 RepID=Q2QR76_ORYSJ|nr:hypothetical protein LOC_Os12g28529 [Oryza sativa Japonica Group]